MIAAMILLVKLQEYTHFWNNIKIFIKLNSTKTIFVKYVDISSIQSLELSMPKNAFKNVCPQRRLRKFSPWNFSPVENWNCPSKRWADGSLAKILHMGLNVHTQLDTGCIYYVLKYCKVVPWNIDNLPHHAFFWDTQYNIMLLIVGSPNCVYSVKRIMNI